MSLPSQCLGVFLEGRHVSCRRSTRNARCDEHAAIHERVRRPSTAARGYGAEWQEFSRQRIAEVGHCQANPCGWPDTQGMSMNPLTTDHATYGLVLCRNDNSRKQHTDRGEG